MDTLSSTSTTMPPMGVGGGMPLGRIIQSYGYKTSRGNRLGRAANLAERTEIYEQPTQGPVTNINVSPTFAPYFSQQDAPLVEGGINLGGFGGGGGIQTGGGAPTGGGTTTRAAGVSTGGGAKAGALTAAQTRLSQADTRAGLKEAAQTGDKINKGELKDLVASGAGIRQVRNIIENKGLTVGGKATDFLNTQLGTVGARPLTTPAQASGGGGGGGGGGKGAIKVPAAMPQQTGTLRSFSYPLPAQVQGSAPKQIVQNAAAIGGNTGKLSQAEAKTALQSGVSANKILKQIEKGNITASKKAVAKLTAQKAAAKKK